MAAPSLYAHVTDRQATLLTVVQDAFEELRQQLEAADAGAEPDPVVRLRAVCAA